MMETARMIEELTKAFHKANETWWEGKLPTPMIIVSRKASKWELGFITTSKVWVENKEVPEVEEGKEVPPELIPQTRYEINISAEGLARPIEEILCTLVHECVHLYHLVNDIKDCSQKIHNKVFKREAERVGLLVERGQGVGYGYINPSPEFIEIVKTWDIDASVFSFVRTETVKPKAPKKGKYKYTHPSDEKIHFTCKYKVEVSDPETAELYNREWEAGDDEEEGEPEDEA